MKFKISKEGLKNYFKQLTWFKMILLFSLFASGACGLVLEHIQATVAIFVLGGNPVTMYIIVYSVMMFAMGRGSRKQVNISDKNLILSFILIEICLAFVGGFSPIFLMWVNGLFPGSFYLFFSLNIYFIGYLIGLEIPIITRINENYSKKLSENIGEVMQADYYGSLAGGIAFAFFLVKFPLTESSFILGIVNLSIAVLAFSVFKWKEKETDLLINFTKPIIVLASFVFIALLLGLNFNRVWASNLEQRLYPYKIIGAWQSPFQRIILLKKINKGVVTYELKINGNSQFDTGDEAIYHESFILPAMEILKNNSKPLNILVLGGGDGMAVRELLKYQKKYNNIGRIILADLDPIMTQLFSGKFTDSEKMNKLLCSFNDNALKDAKVVTLSGLGVNIGESESFYQFNGKFGSNSNFYEEKVCDLNVINIDADVFLKELIEKNDVKFDLIVSDFPDASTAGLSKLYAKEFYLKIKTLLNRRGLLVVQSGSTDKTLEAYQCIGRTIKASGFNVLPYQQYVGTWNGMWGWWMAWHDDISEEIIQREIAEIEFEIPTKFLTGDVFRSQLIFGKYVRTGKPYFESAQFDDVNSQSHPIVHSLYNNYSRW